jgi:hypothetical protein
MELVALVRADEVISAKRLGSVVCVAIVERSAHAKARVMACQICQECIDSVGLSACGKRGVLAAAKSLSDEKIPENRIAALDLMEVILTRMNGEIQKLTRICGPNLSDKALLLLEERRQKRGTLMKSQTPTPARPTTSSIDRLDGQPGLFDELPALSLRPSVKESAQFRLNQTADEKEESNDFFAFSRSVETLTDPKKEADEIRTEIVPVQLETGIGAASSLRARLLKIREKTKTPAEILDTTATLESVDPPQTRQHLPKSSPLGHFDDEMDTIRVLVARIGPLAEDDPDLVACIDSLKRIHAALSKQHNPVVGLSTGQLSELRERIADRMDFTVMQLTR